MTAAPGRATKPTVPIDRRSRRRRATRPIFCDGEWRDAGVPRRDTLKPGQRVCRARADHREPPDDRRRAGLAGRVTAKNHVLLRRVEKKRRSGRARHRGRPGPARSLQQSVHVDRRADGRDAAEHRLFREHQGAARLLLRRLRPQRRAGRQRAAYAGASGLDGPLGRDHHPPQPGRHPPGRRLRAQRALQWRHASARHHRRDAGLRRRPAPGASSSMSPRAAIMPMSAAWRRAR